MIPMISICFFPCQRSHRVHGAVCCQRMCVCSTYTANLLCSILVTVWLLFDENEKAGVRRIRPVIVALCKVVIAPVIALPLPFSNPQCQSDRLAEFHLLAQSLEPPSP